MKLEHLHIGQKIRHPHYGPGEVRSLGVQTAEIEFADGLRTIAPEASGIEPADPEPVAAVAGQELPLSRVIEKVVRATLEELGIESPDAVVRELGARWLGGKLVLHPEDAALQAKEIPLEVFFHKIVMVRNQLRVLEQKINANEKLSDADKVELQQYVTRSYGSLTTFNILFKDKESHF